MAGRSFDRDAAERVIRRAIQLDDHAAPPAPGAVTESALAEAAEELGIDISAVRRAAAEERLGVLHDTPTIADRIVGAGTVLAVRPFPCTPERASAAVDTWLRRTGGFRTVKVDGFKTRYDRRKDPVATVQRAARSVTGKETLESGIDKLTVLIEPLDNGECLVAFAVDRELGQTAAMIGVGGIAGIGSAACVTVAAVGPDIALVGIPGALALAAGLAWGRRVAVHDTDTNLSGVLNAIASDLPALSSASSASSSTADDPFGSVSQLLTKGSSLRRAATRAAKAATSGPTNKVQSKDDYRASGGGTA